MCTEIPQKKKKKKGKKGEKHTDIYWESVDQPTVSDSYLEPEPMPCYQEQEACSQELEACSQEQEVCCQEPEPDNNDNVDEDTLVLTEDASAPPPIPKSDCDLVSAPSFSAPPSPDTPPQDVIAEEDGVLLCSLCARHILEKHVPVLPARKESAVIHLKEEISEGWEDAKDTLCRKDL